MANFIIFLPQPSLRISAFLLNIVGEEFHRLHFNSQKKLMLACTFNQILVSILNTLFHQYGKSPEVWIFAL